MREPDDDKLIEEISRRLHKDRKWFLGDMSPAEVDYWGALEELEEVRELHMRAEAEEWAWSVLTRLAKKGARDWNRGRGNRTTYKGRNKILETEARRLIKRGRDLSLRHACKIIHKAMERAKIPGSLTAGGIEKAIGKKSKLLR